MTRGLPILDGPGRDVVEGPPAPPWGHQPLVEWQVVGQCNYDCSYCIQSKKYRKGAPNEDALERSLAFLASLPAVDEGWEIKTTGGEPFSWRPFLDVVVPRLMGMPHVTLSTLTNLSASVDDLVRFAALTWGRLRVVSASLHLEHTGVSPFLARLELLRQRTKSARLVVNCVLAPGALAAVRQAKREVEEAGFVFFPQLMKVKGGVHAYSPAEIASVEEIVGDLALAEVERSANTAPAYTGRRCWTGARYLVLDKDGSGWSCRTAKRFGEGHLGTVATGITLREGPIACPYTICPCTTPANRGMIEGVR